MNIENNSGEIIQKVSITQQMQEAYIDYSMSVITARALPDVRDGLKPVQRRVLWGMYELNNTHDKPHKKSARIVGEVLGKYHPHGDSSVYEAMVRMAQDWNMRYPLIDGQGNFGSIDGDPPAAMRYTEVRLNELAEELLEDIDKNTVDFRSNFDDTLQEPVVLPAKIPNLLINGASGIAVGMATNMPPHNLNEVCDAIIAYINNNNLTTEELLKILKAPDFPTGGIIYGYKGIIDYFNTGRGKIIVRAKTYINTEKNKEQIIVTEIPYQVNKSELIKKIADLVNEHKIEGISNITDESDREGIRIVIDIKRDANANVVLNNLFKLSPLQVAYNVNNICLVNNRPKLLKVIDLIKLYVENRLEIITRRTKYELSLAQKREHIVSGFLKAIDNIDEIVSIIKKSENAEVAKLKLIERFSFTEDQAKAILAMRLQSLTNLERNRLLKEYEELIKRIEELNKILSNDSLKYDIIIQELNHLKKKFGDNRRTEIVYEAEELAPEDFYENEDCVITISHMNYIKRTPLSLYRIQNRGGTGLRISDVREEDFIEHICVTKLHNTLLLFTNKGKCYWLKAYQIPEGDRQSKGRPLQNVINISKDEHISAYIHLENINDEIFVNNHYVVFCTKKGYIKKTLLKEFSRPRASGIISININEDDELIEAKLTNGNYDIIIATRKGRAVRFKESQVRPMKRNASGVKGITLSSADDYVVGMVCIENEKEDLLIVTENGYGKRTKVSDYPLIKRGGKGVKTFKITPKTGNLLTIKGVLQSDQLMIITKNGIGVRINVKDINVLQRITQGVKLINLKNNDKISSITYIENQNLVEENNISNINLN